jgi:hypothetical protein
MKAGAGNDASAHLMNERKHLLLGRPCTLVNSVFAQRLGRAAPALVQRGKKSRLCFNFPLLLFLQAVHSCVFRSERLRLDELIIKPELLNFPTMPFEGDLDSLSAKPFGGGIQLLRYRCKCNHYKNRRKFLAIGAYPLEPAAATSFAK